jgi:glycerol-3-phosphate dehydrogenase
MEPQDARNAALARLGEPWDLLIVGGGITGAGILLEASRRGLRALLIEQRDFAWGTSSRSSKLVHGGLRYLKEGQLGLTRESVRERQRLLQQAPGLVEEQGFAFADYAGRKPGRWMFSLGLAVYDRLAGSRARAYDAPDAFLLRVPHIDDAGLRGGLRYLDAKTDDARLVLRVLQEARAHGGVALNYLACADLLRDANGVCGATVEDRLGGGRQRIQARVVINATGASADALRGRLGHPKRLRPLRGSHLLFPFWRLPVAQAVGLMHPADGRPVFFFPWEGATLVGTTDLDHDDPDGEPRISPQEVAYLMAALHCQFPGLALDLDDILSTYAGVRPVVASGQADPSKEGRDHVCWLEDGLLTVTGGKLTTFRVIALDALNHAARALGRTLPSVSSDAPLFAPPAALDPGIPADARARLTGRYGTLATQVAATAQAASDWERVPGSDTRWLELRWAAGHEDVAHLDDLLLRRTRLGLLAPQGAAAHLPRIRALCQAELGWDDARWQAEETSYRELIASHYALPPRDSIPDWRTAQAKKD